ncbi:MAG: branched-chain amino acid ABC transporter substrate-binding protein [Deltaproteobacteria bacterium]|jgi:branched-chain amino acid transport system substrate-binding protein|nr:branched-chain amino acid ABC transporter substrate-binding protein [Deltaproteobacteria bacterium]
MPKSWAPKIWLAIAWAIFGLGLGPLAEIQADDKKLKIGFGAALLGNLASYGQSNFFGLEYAVLKANKNGGILGQTLEIVIADDSCNPAQAKIAAKKLLNKDVKLIIGHTCSGATRAALDVYGDKALVISGSATENALTDSGKYPYFFRATPRGDIQVKLQLALLRKNGYRQVAILHDKSDYGEAMAENARQLLTASPDSQFQVTIFAGLNPGQDYEAIIAKLLETKTEALIWGGYYNDAAKLATQIHQKDPNFPIIGSDGLKDNRFLNLAQKAAEGVYCVGQPSLSHSQAAQEALKDHRSRYYSQEVGSYFFYAAGAAEALFAALTKAGTTDNFAAIKKSLNEDTVETVMGPIRFDAKGDIIGAGYKMFQVRQGRFVEVPL